MSDTCKATGEPTISHYDMFTALINEGIIGVKLKDGREIIGAVETVTELKDGDAVVWITPTLAFFSSSQLPERFFASEAAEVLW